MPGKSMRPRSAESSKAHLAGDPLLFQARPELLALLPEKALFRCPLQSVFPVRPVRVAVVEPVYEHGIRPALEQGYQSLRAWQYRRYHDEGPYALRVKDLQCLESLLYRRRAGLEYPPHPLISRCYRESGFNVPCALDDIQVPQDKGRFGLNGEGPSVLREKREASPREQVPLLDRLVGVAHSAYPDPPRPFPAELLFKELRGGYLHIHKVPPPLVVPR